MAPPWFDWLDAHTNRELGVGTAVGGAITAPDRRGIDALLDVLGAPQQQYPSVLVGGTNGKTTVARTIGALLQGPARRVGVYTSPHLHRRNERMTINGVPIDDENLSAHLARVAAVEPTLAMPLSWFEIITAVAFAWFAEQRVDLAVIEVGLGGEWDATAAATGPLVVVTNIDLDHTEYFGPSVQDVARAEASIVSESHTLLLGETDPGLVACFADRAPRKLWRRGPDFEVVRRVPTPRGQWVTVTTVAGATANTWIPLRGAAHAENVSLAVAAAELVGGPLDEGQLSAVAATLESPGRAEILGSRPQVLLDGAHNPAGARTLAAMLAESFPDRPRSFVLGMSGDKPVRLIIESLRIENRDRVHCCAARNPRALPPDQLAAIVTATTGATTDVHPAVSEALDQASRTAGPGGVVVVTGSLYLVAEARAETGLASGRSRDD